MDPKPNKAVAAAISAAVMNYIKSQEEALSTAPAMALPGVAPVTASLYGASGRQQMMEMRRLLSLRMGRR